ncbi:MAG: AEC family transporter [Christensenellales bacterium]|jgi:predicted permease|nr:AEC family transporter [Clostridiales bacterium]
MQSLQLAINAVAPILMYLLMGRGLKRFNKISETTRSELNKIIYAFCLPTVLFSNIYHAKGLDRSLAPYVLLLCSLSILSILLSLLILSRKIKDRAKLTTMTQGIFRGNSILFAVPVCLSVLGEEGAALASVAVAFLVPLYTMSATIFMQTINLGQVDKKKLALDVLKNPLIVGALCAFFLRFIGLKLPNAVTGVIKSIASLTMPLALVVLGAGLTFTDTKKYKKELFVVCLGKLVLLPLMFFLVTKLFGFGRMHSTVALIIAAVPTAVSSYQFAVYLKGDGPLAAQIVAATSVFSIVTIFLWMYFLSLFGLIGG